MGLSVSYKWRKRLEVAGARRLIQRMHRIAQSLPFDELSEIFEYAPPDGTSSFKHCERNFLWGSLYLERTRSDGEKEVVKVPAEHTLYFHGRIEGAETVAVGLAAHPSIVEHRPDVIEREEGGGTVHRLNAGEPIIFETGLAGRYSWQSFCKTQYAGLPKFGGESNFLKAHLSLIELCDRIGELGMQVRVRDDSRYARHRNVPKLLKSLREWNGIVAAFTGAIGDALTDAARRNDPDAEPPHLIAPIKSRSDFEHLEADGLKILKKLAARQRRRKKRRDGET